MALHQWSQLTSAEIRDLMSKDPLIVITIGSLEQHGAHLPVDTDSSLVAAISTAAAAQAAIPEIIHLQPLAVGFSPHHMQRSGSITFRLTTFLAAVEDVVRSIWGHGFRRIVLVNGHGGNAAPLTALQTQMAADGVAFGLCSYWDVMKNAMEQILTGPRKTVGHACEMETSLQLLLNPDAVFMDRAVTRLGPPWNPQRDHDPLAALGAPLAPVFHRCSSGVHGAALEATAAKGEALYRAAVDNLCRYLELFYRTVLESQGRGIASHSGQAHLGRSAIEPAVKLLAEIFALDKRLAASFHPLVGRPSLTPTVIQGGTAQNTVPEHCSLIIDRRLVPGEDFVLARQELADCLRQADVESDLEAVEEIVANPPCETDPAAAIVAAAQRGAAALGLDSTLSGFPAGSGHQAKGIADSS